MYIIGDVHGCAKSLAKLLEKIPEDAEVFSTGDLVDRGPDSRGVISLCIKRGIRAVMGNHEHMLLDYIDGTGHYASGTYFMNGGAETLAAYEEGLPSQHVKYLRALPLYIETEHFFLSHSGVHFLKTLQESCDLSQGTEHNILWNRAGLATLCKPQIVGHSMQRNVLTEMKNDKLLSINIDTGCCSPAYGKLTAISMPDRKIIEVDCADKVDTLR